MRTQDTPHSRASTAFLHTFSPLWTNSSSLLAALARTSSTLAWATRVTRRLSPSSTSCVRRYGGHTIIATRLLVGIGKLRLAVADYYRRRFGVHVDSDNNVVATIGVKEGFAHLIVGHRQSRRRGTGAHSGLSYPHVWSCVRPMAKSYPCPSRLLGTCSRA